MKRLINRFGDLLLFIVLTAFGVLFATVFTHFMLFRFLPMMVEYWPALFFAVPLVFMRRD